MYAQVTRVVNPTGLHARPASDFVSLAKTFSSKIKISDLTNDEAPGNAKSIVTLLSFGLSQGTDIEISAEGEDEIGAVKALVSLVESGFGETE